MTLIVEHKLEGTVIGNTQIVEEFMVHNIEATLNPNQGNRNLVYEKIINAIGISEDDESDFNPDLVAGEPEIVRFPSRDQAVVRVTWSTKEESGAFWAFGINTNVQQDRTLQDANGNPLKIELDLSIAAGSNDAPQSGNFHIAEADVFVPRLELVIIKDFRDYASALPDLLGVIGKINDAPWLRFLPNEFSSRLRPFDIKHHWLCTSCVTEQFSPFEAGFVTARVRTSFAFNEETWNPLLTLVDPLTGQAYPNMTDPRLVPLDSFGKENSLNAIARYGVQPFFDFTSVNWAKEKRSPR